MENLFKSERWKVFEISDSNEITYQKFYISDFGRVRIRNQKESTFKFAPMIEEKGYLMFSYISNNHFHKKFAVHRAVAMAFLNKRSNSYNFVVHKDYNKHNNHYRNLKWLTVSGLKKFHEKRHEFYFEGKHREISTKLSIKQVKEIKKALKKTEASYGNLSKLAKEYHVSTSQISRIKIGENWSHVTNQ